MLTVMVPAVINWHLLVKKIPPVVKR